MALNATLLNKPRKLFLIVSQTELFSELFKIAMARKRLMAGAM